MAQKPALAVMAAGMGSRYGGLKQIDTIGPNGEILLDYSLYDARRAGFENVVFIIRKEKEDAFRKAIGDRMGKYFFTSSRREASVIVLLGADIWGQPPCVGKGVINL